MRRSLSHKYRNPGDCFKCNRSSQYLEGPLKILRPYLDFDTCTVPFLMIPFRILSVEWGRVPSTTLLDYKTKQKQHHQVIDVCVCHKWIDFIRYGRFLYSALFCRLELVLGWNIRFGFLSCLISSGVLPFLVISSQQPHHFCVSQ